ncbi:MAG TPA: hypothetical protein DCP91_11835 [Eggerthellaceae bacterium]|nr:hypothetical protein [Eggerthellaceae bacterium]
MPISVNRFDDLAANVLSVYEEAERHMMGRVAARLQRGVTQPGWTEKKYGEMRAVSREMQAYLANLQVDRRELQQQYLEQAYETARAAHVSDAYTFGQVTGIQGLTPNTTKVVNIMSELDDSMRAADRRILRSVNDAYADIVGRASALVATGSITYRDAVQRELNHFADRGITSFVDKAGRQWDMETYAEMATLTAIERATIEGYVDSMREFDYDLAEISSHIGACPVCEQWEGVIVSISGNDTRYPSLDDARDAGVFHPRCIHDISTYYEGISPKGRSRPTAVTPAPSAAYTARSQQRKFERMERQWKRRMEVAGSPEEERDAYARVKLYQQRIRELIGDYNDEVPSSYDYLPRKYRREGGRVTLSEAAKKLAPVIIPDAQQPKRVVLPSTLGEFSPFRRAASGAANRVMSQYGVTLRDQSRDDIMNFFRNVERTGGMTMKLNENGTPYVSMHRAAYEALDALTNSLTDRIKVQDKEIARDYADLNAILRNTPLYISKYDRANIPDFGEYARSPANHVRTTLSRDAMSVDSAYKELQEIYPGYFSGESTNPADRLMEINQVLDGLRESRSMSARDYYGEAGLREMRGEIWRDLTREYFNVRDKSSKGGR